MLCSFVGLQLCFGPLGLCNGLRENLCIRSREHLRLQLFDLCTVVASKLNKLRTTWCMLSCAE